MATLWRTALREMILNVVRLLKNEWQNRPSHVLRLVVLSAFISALPFVQSGSLALLLNAVTDPIRKADGSSVFFATLIAVVGSFLPEYVFALKGYADKRHWLAMQTDYEMAFHSKKAAIDLSAYEDPKFLNLIQKFDEQWIYPLLRLTDAQYQNIQNVIEVIVASVILALHDVRILFLVLLSSIPAFIVEMKYGYGFWGIFDAAAPERRRYEQYKQHFSIIHDLLEIRLFQSARFFLKQMQELIVSFLKQQANLERKKVLWQLLAVTAVAVGVGTAVVLIVLDAVRGTVLVGTMTFLLYSIRDLRNAASGFLLNLGSQYRDSLFVSDGFALLDAKPRLPRSEYPKALDTSKAPAIRLEKVTFAYPDTSRTVLHDVSLNIGSGERFGLVGLNGAGKTTLVKLLCRIYDPTEGRVLVSNADLRDVDMEQWWQMVAVLFQDYANFKMLAKEVISLGRVEDGKVNMNRVIEAAKHSGASQFIEQWQAQYEQMIGREFDGIELSKGQLQKIALSRVFYREPRLMILDEPTASIDAQTEKQIFDHIEQLPRDITIILISHRFSTLRNADRICVLNEGRVAELGTHTELMQRNGEYARLFKLQASGYASEVTEKE